MWTTENAPATTGQAALPSDLTDEEWSLVEPLILRPSVAVANARWWCGRW